MTIQLATPTRNARMNALVSDVGASPYLSIWSGSMPANAAAPSTGTKLVEYPLASTWAASASGGAVTLAGLPLTESAIAGAPTNAGYWRLFQNDNATCKAQGTITVSGGGGDMTIDSIAINAGQTVYLTGGTLTDSGA